MRPGRVSVAQALALVVEGASRLGSESVALRACFARILDEDLRAAVDVPAFARSAVDGFAIACRDLEQASQASPVSLPILQSLLPGEPAAPELAGGGCARVATGAPIPQGADAVVMLEDVREGGDLALFDAPTSRGKHVISVGEDVRAGELLLVRGRCLRAPDLGLAASLEIATLQVVRKPRVAVVVTGNEMVPPGQARAGTSVIDSNSIVVESLAARDGASLNPTAYVRDDLAGLTRALEKADADVVLVSGGSSAGSEDHAPAALERFGQALVRGVAMRPGGPVSFGRLGSRWVFLLPGHPLACLAAYEFFAGPAIRALAGRPLEWPHRRARASLSSAVRSISGRTDYVRVEVQGGRATPLTHHTGASSLSSAVRANGAIVVAHEVESLEVGDEVDVFLY